MTFSYATHDVNCGVNQSGLLQPTILADCNVLVIAVRSPAGCSLRSYNYFSKAMEWEVAPLAVVCSVSSCPKCES